MRPQPCWPSDMPSSLLLVTLDLRAGAGKSHTKQSAREASPTGYVGNGRGAPLA